MDGELGCDQVTQSLLLHIGFDNVFNEMRRWKQREFDIIDAVIQSAADCLLPSEDDALILELFERSPHSLEVVARMD